MKPRFYFLFTFFSLLFLFYPGNSLYFDIFAYNRALLATNQPHRQIRKASIPYVKAAYYPEISAEGVYVADLPSFTPVLKRNPHAKLFPASTTKVLTALVAYDIYKPDQIITIKNVQPEGQVMGLVPGERITVENLLYGTLVHSGNDAAYALGQNYGLADFVTLMNKKAQALKMTDSHFTNPAGLDDSNQYSTAYDLALAGRTLLENSYLAKIVSTKEIIISDVDFKYFHTLTNVNKLLGKVQGIGGLKTGSTPEAGENLVSLYKRNDGHEFIIVILKSFDRFKDTQNAVSWLDNNVAYSTL